MKKIKTWKATLFAFTTILLFFIGSYALLISAFSGGQKFYMPLILIIGGVLFLYNVLWSFEIVKTKLITIGLFSILGICAIAVTGYEAHRSYINSFPIVNEQGVDLEEYMPFAANTKAVVLIEPSSLKLTTNLPKLDGATALYPLYAAFVKAVYPKKDYEVYNYNSDVRCTTTITAYENLINGEVDMIFCARPSKKQLELAKSKGVELKLTPIGREAFVFFVNSQNSIKGLTTSQIQDIYSGKITNWKALGGNDEPIKAFQRPEGSGSQTMLQKLMEGKKLMTPPKEDVIQDMGGIIEQTANYRNFKNAIGYSFLFFATEMVKNKQIRLLSVNEIDPTRETIKNKNYPLASEFYIVTAGSKNPNIDRFIQWILSPQGQYLVEKTGYTPLR